MVWIGPPLLNENNQIGKQSWLLSLDFHSDWTQIILMIFEKLRNNSTVFWEAHWFPFEWFVMNNLMNFEQIVMLTQCDRICQLRKLHNALGLAYDVKNLDISDLAGSCIIELTLPQHLHLKNIKRLSYPGVFASKYIWFEKRSKIKSPFLDLFWSYFGWNDQSSVNLNVAYGVNRQKFSTCQRFKNISSTCFLYFNIGISPLCGWTGLVWNHLKLCFPWSFLLILIRVRP